MNDFLSIADNDLEDTELFVTRHKPERLEALCRNTKFTRKEIRLMYQGFKQLLSPLLPQWTPGLVSAREGGDFLVRRPRSNHVFSLPFLFTCIAYPSMNFAVIMANVGKRKAFSIGAEKHGVNDFSPNEIEYFECCDDDVITSGEVSEEDIMALVNRKNNSIVDSSSDMEEERDEPWPSIADAKTF
ncbi:hypothetical protein AVEN_180554-1 [Araneus ventricosus]|uniref:Uncharacterized protein n=1 Tax=Araneus ventricosus TaxID=182803 RepID=A0A4Y2FNQ2_ARAVE|nr:hypothetical protein AVEN_180554-1 [Araneus ventricosus]